MEDLMRRVSQLEKRVEELYSLEEGLGSRPSTKGKKLRRRFSEMDRNYQVTLTLLSAPTAANCTAQKPR